MATSSFTYPRLDLARAMTLIGEYVELDDLPKPPSQFALSSASWRAVAAAPRADVAHLSEVREAVLRAASDAGFPERPDASARRRFDAALPHALHDVVGMSPAESSSPEAWAYLTLCVVPDVARWRYPNVPTKDGGVNLQYGRYMGGTRNVLRQAWRRKYLLGDLIEVFDEDGFEQIRGRRLFDNAIVAREYAGVLRERLEGGADFSQRLLTRQTSRLLQRWSTIIAFEFLTPKQVRATIREAFAETEAALSKDSNTRPDVEHFLGELPNEIAQQEPFTDEDVVDLRQRVDLYAARFTTDLARANRIRNILWDLIEAWPELEKDERRVATAATRYFLTEQDGLPDDAPGGLADDEEVAIDAKKLIEAHRKAGEVHPT